MSEHKSIFKSASVISLFTVISRLTGFLRDVLLANVFGTGMAAQAFFTAFKIPNVLRDVMGEGAGNAAFVPVFCEELAKKPRADFLRLVNSLMVFLIVASLVISVLGIFLASPIVRLIAPGFLVDPAKFHLTVWLTRLLFPYLILVTVSAYLASVSNALKSFAVPASSSTVFNVVLIAGLLLVGVLAKGAGGQAVYAVALFVLVAGFAQILFQGPSLFKRGVNLGSGGFDVHFFKQESVRKIGRLILPRLGGTSIYQLNVFVDTIFASSAFFAGEGAVAAIYYANRIIQFPFSVFGVAFSNAALPTMSASSAAKDMDAFKAALEFSFKTVFLCVIPLTCGLLVFASPLVRVIFERGSFNAYSTAITTEAVFFYAFGLLAYVGVRFLSHGFYALQDTMTPVRTSAVALIMNVILNSLFIFVFRLKLSGLALASSVSASVNFYLLYRLMKRRTGFSFAPAFGEVVAKSLWSSVAMIFVLLAFFYRVFFLKPSWGLAFLIFVTGAFVYAAFLGLLKVKEFTRLLSWLQKKR